MLKITDIELRESSSIFQSQNPGKILSKQQASSIAELHSCNFLGKLFFSPPELLLPFLLLTSLLSCRALAACNALETRVHLCRKDAYCNSRKQAVHKAY